MKRIYDIDYRERNPEKIKSYKKQNMRKRRESDIRNRTNKAFKSQTIRKTNKTIDLIGCSIEFFKRWIIHQLYGDMTIEKYGST